VTHDPYVDPQTGVLRNRLGIADAEILWQAVADISAARLAELAVRPLPGAYNLDHLRTFHRAIFGDVFEWAAYYHAEINEMHPYREGNGRAQRAFLGQLSTTAGYRLDWTIVGEQENIDAAVAAHRGDLEPLTRLLERIVRGV
jgi:cell filamentation protein